MYRAELADKVFDEYSPKELGQYYIHNYEEYAIDLAYAILESMVKDEHNNQLKIQFEEE